MDNNNEHISDELIAAFLDGNVSKNEARDILSALPEDSELSKILALSPMIDAEIKQEKVRILPMCALAAANSKNLCSFDCETFILQHLDFDIDNWSLLETAKANNWVREEGTPLHLVGKLLELKGLHVQRKYDSSPRDLDAGLKEGRQVIAIIDRNIMEKVHAKREPSFHAVYVTAVDNDSNVTYLNLDNLKEETIEKDRFLKAWKCSSNYMVTASPDDRGYNPQPINVEDIDLDASLEELTEAIAENAHDIWARARMDEGWTYGPVRDDAKRHHPDLVPYSQLPDSEKEYDRIMAMNTLRLVHRLGYTLSPPQQILTHGHSRPNDI